MEGFTAESLIERRKIRAWLPERNAVLIELAPESQVSEGDSRAAIAFVLDFSGSMSGSPEKRVRSAMHEMLGEIRATDLVSIIPFSTTVETDTPLLPGTEVETLRDFVSDQRASGSTNMVAALKRAREHLAAAPGDAVRQVCILTDGHPNHASGALNAAQGLAEDGIRKLLPIAYGSYDGDFLQELASATPGVLPFFPDVGGAEFSLEEHLRSIVRTARSTVLTNLRLEVKLTKDVIVQHVYAETNGESRYLGQAQIDEDRTCTLEGLPDVSREGTRIFLDVLNPARPPGTYKVCTVKLFYDLPKEQAVNRSRSLEPLRVTYTTDEWDITDPDPAVQMARDTMPLPRYQKEYEAAKARGDGATADATRQAMVRALRRRGQEDKARMLEEENPDPKLVKQLCTKTAQVKSSAGKRLSPKMLADD